MHTKRVKILSKAIVPAVWSVLFDYCSECDLCTLSIACKYVQKLVLEHVMKEGFFKRRRLLDFSNAIRLKNILKIFHRCRVQKLPIKNPTETFFSFVKQDERIPSFILVAKLLLCDSRIDPSAFDNIAVSYATVAQAPNLLQRILEFPQVDPTSATRGISEKSKSWAGWNKLLKILVTDERIDPNMDDGILIKNAVLTGSAEVVEALSKRPQIDPMFLNDAFQEACQKDQHQIVQVLLHDPRVDPSRNRNQALSEASFRGLFDIVQLLRTDRRVRVKYIERPVFDEE